MYLHAQYTQQNCKIGGILFKIKQSTTHISFYVLLVT